MQLRYRHVKRQIDYLENDYPKIKRQIQAYAAIEKGKSTQQAEQLIESQYQAQGTLERKSESQNLKNKKNSKRSKNVQTT